jgi:hypothetical protein
MELLPQVTCTRADFTQPNALELQVTFGTPRRKKIPLDIAQDGQTIASFK